ncbi:unnamed protein product [Lactuca saligna]|uniref:Uncharacterized protein n=1 Tax=Lactuca saligna TaxID=75948 RepID=A0AA36DZK9_LACSI|nr:unnamed protein product [Lactuca saligna]
MAIFCVGDSYMGEEDVCDIIATKIFRFMKEDLPGLINTIIKELVVVMDEHLRILQAELEGGWPCGRRVNFKEFDACVPLRFFPSKESIINMCWIANVESALCASFCPT